MVTPSAASLPPWGTLRVDLACCTDMCGQYADVLHCQVNPTHHLGAQPEQTDAGAPVMGSCMPELKRLPREATTCCRGCKGPAALALSM